VGQGAHEAQPQAARRAAQAHLDLVGGAGERGVGAGRRALAVGGVRGVQRRPARPPPALDPRADLRLHLRASGPAQAHEIEAVRGA
jgi:hypothetical protein